MKKRILALLVIALVLAACTPGNGGAEVVRIETLAYDQELAYIALSKNDVSGYNRWIPFYFVVQVAEGCSVDEVEDALSRHVREIRLFAKGGELVFSTEELIWSAFQLPGGVSNLSLVVIPECGALKCDGTVTLERLALLIDEKTVEFPISDYIIEEKETSSEKLA